MKIPFDIKYKPQIESGEYKVVTRDELPVRIICWDWESAGDGQPIVALVENEHYAYCVWVEENGVYKDTMGHDYDLFIITPEPELTKFEKAIYNILSFDCSIEEDSFRVEFAKSAAKDLLALAKKELLGQWNEDMKNEYARGKRNGITIGYNKAMKKYNESVAYHYQTYCPPCLHGGECTNPMGDCISCPRTGGDIGISTTSGTCKKD